MENLAAEFFAGIINLIGYYPFLLVFCGFISTALEMESLALQSIVSQIVLPELTGQYLPSHFCFLLIQTCQSLSVRELGQPPSEGGRLTIFCSW